uniref:Uncharacterized protein n=1 Tax=Anguilla anguilla TaxID=7936 RepID=A0A0E9T4N8_ANGAN
MFPYATMFTPLLLSAPSKTRKSMLSFYI